MVKLSKLKPDKDRKIDPFILIGESIALDESLQLPLKLAENVYLKKADTAHIQTIKMKLLPFLYLNGLNLIAHEVYSKPTGEAGNSSIELRVESDWQYWIITHTNFYVEENLTISLELSELNLTPILSVFGQQGSSFQLNPQIASSYYQENYWCKVKMLSQSEINDIQAVRALLDNFDGQKSQFTFIEKAINDFISLKALPPRSPFIIIGIFSIIELLITSNLNSSPSISHQMRTKISLLIRRFERPLSFSEFFKGPNTLTIEKIIDKMYQYRSDIAHGNMIDFESDLQVLHSQENTVSFLRIFLRRLIRQCLIEPQFIADLKKC